MIWQLMLYAMLGAMLGLRFRVPILVPTTTICFLSAAGLAYFSDIGTWGAIVLIVASMTSHQIGYLAGAAVGILITGSTWTATPPGQSLEISQVRAEDARFRLIRTSPKSGLA